MNLSYDRAKRFIEEGNEMVSGHAKDNSVCRSQSGIHAASSPFRGKLSRSEKDLLLPSARGRVGERKRGGLPTRISTRIRKKSGREEGGKRSIVRDTRHVPGGV